MKKLFSKKGTQSSVCDNPVISPPLPLSSIIDSTIPSPSSGSAAASRSTRGWRKKNFTNNGGSPSDKNNNNELQQQQSTLERIQIAKDEARREWAEVENFHSQKQKAYQLRMIEIEQTELDKRLTECDKKQTEFGDLKDKHTKLEQKLNEEITLLQDRLDRCRKEHANIQFDVSSQIDEVQKEIDKLERSLDQRRGQVVVSRQDNQYESVNDPSAPHHDVDDDNLSFHSLSIRKDVAVPNSSYSKRSTLEKQGRYTTVEAGHHRHPPPKPSTRHSLFSVLPDATRTSLTNAASMSGSCVALSSGGSVVAGSSLSSADSCNNSESST